MKNIFQILVIVLLEVILPVQFANAKDGPEQDYMKAERLIEGKKYSEALPLYLSVLDIYPENPGVNFRVGQCYMNQLGQERKALPYLQKAVNKINPDFKQGELSDKGAAPIAWLLLGDAYHRDEQPKLASEAYHSYMKYIDHDKKEMDLVNDRIMTLGVAQRQEQMHASDVVLTNLGNKINSKFSEYNIVYSGDEKTMVFSRYEKRKDIIFASHYENGGWTDPIDITEQIGSEGDMYATALSYDGKELYLVLLTAYDADLYVSQFENGQWQYAENLGRNINSKYVESNACISADGNTFYFSSDRASGIGGFDIFFSQKVDGKWEKAENVGETINTNDNEESPFITEDGSRLYFSSDRKGSIGRMDIYFSKKNNESGWSEPENLGMPYNSVEDDISFKFYGKYRKGYIARDLPGGMGKLDIYLLQSGEDRQRELQDYMASLAPDPKEQETTPVIQEETVTEEKESATLTSESTSGIAASSATVVAANNIVAEEKKTEISEPVEQEVEPEKTKTSEDVLLADTPVEKEVEEATEEIAVTLVREPVQETINEPVTDEQVTFEGDYTIQFLALIFPKRQTTYKGLNPSLIRRVESSDGYTRYIYGQYTSREEAVNDLKLVFKHGYSDAFIRVVPQ